jgi:TPR repeat protein
MKGRAAVGTLVVALALAAWQQAASGSDMAAGVAAFKKGDYATARMEFEGLAYEGQAAAQANLALMYAKGYGVNIDEAAAVRWYQMAAEQGQAAAQNNLASMYLAGEGVRKDPVLGFMWLLLAKEGRSAAAVQSVGDLERQLSPRQIELGHSLAALWKQKIALEAQAK